MATRGLVIAENGAVAASQPLAVSAALLQLASGGTFADAAIAASAVLAVVEPWASHLGGDAFLIVHDARTRTNTAYNGSGAAPKRATPDAYAAGIPVHGPRSATVPGLVDTWCALHERHGSRPLAELLASAIGYARDGFAASPRFVARFADAAALFSAQPSLSALGAGPDVTVGQRIVQPELARTLEAIAAHGRAGFYDGSVGARIVAASGGHFTLDDLAAHRTRVLAPIATSYRGLIVHGQPPPSQGMILLEELALAEGFDLATLDEIERTHVLVEAKKLAFADRVAHLADPEWHRVPVETLLSRAFIAARRRAIGPTAADDPPAGALSQGSDTTYFLVADRTGSAVSFIQSVFHVFGSGQIADGTGVLFNNRLTGFSLDPASPNALAPGKRPAHTLNAWLATHADGRLAYVGGTPGAHVQVQTNLQLLVNLVDLGLDPQSAIDAPRWQHLNDAGGNAAVDPIGPGLLEIEERVGADVIDGLRARGHRVRAIGPWAHGSAAQVLAVQAGGALAVGSDPRCDGHAAGL
jgi:gamma-glutamyltranspeptidase/glutathione hydrolase